MVAMGTACGGYIKLDLVLTYRPESVVHEYDCAAQCLHYLLLHGAQYSAQPRAHPRRYYIATITPDKKRTTVLSPVHYNSI